MSIQIDCLECRVTKIKDYTKNMDEVSQPICKCGGSGKITVYTEAEIQKAIKDEREACAKICDNIQMDYWDDSTGRECGIAIRARGEKQ